MCVGGIARIAETWEEGTARVGRLDDGCVVTLAYVPEVSAGEYVLVHLGIPVEVIDERTAHEALNLRAEGSVQ